MDGGPTGKYCPITPQESKGVNCSAGVSDEIPYAAVMNRILTEKWNITEIRWDNTMKTPFCNVYGHGHTDNLLQYWYDDPQSLSYKYNYAKTMNLRGLGPYQFGDIIYDNSDNEIQRRVEMWSAFDVFYV